MIHKKITTNNCIDSVYKNDDIVVLNMYMYVFLLSTTLLFGKTEQYMLHIHTTSGNLFSDCNMFFIFLKNNTFKSEKCKQKQHFE